jgi:hypothetical protein
MNQLNRHLRKRIAVFTVPFLFAIVLILSSPCAFSQSDGKPILKGSVEHSDRLAPVQGQVGSVFDGAAQLGSVPPKREWYRVPPWLAGSWEADESTQTSYTNYKTDTVNSNIVTSPIQSHDYLGLQRDRLGGVWQIVQVPYISEFSTADSIIKDLHTDDSAISDSDTSLVMRIIATRTTVAKSTNTISNISQMEFIKSYSLAGPQLVKSETSAKAFDQQGNPIALVKAWAVLHRIAPFAGSDQFDGKDVRSLFRSYLMEHGLENLVPQE